VDKGEAARADDPLHQAARHHRPQNRAARDHPSWPLHQGRKDVQILRRARPGAEGTAPPIARVGKVARRLVDEQDLKS